MDVKNISFVFLTLPSQYFNLLHSFVERHLNNVLLLQILFWQRFRDWHYVLQATCFYIM